MLQWVMMSYPVEVLWYPNRVDRVSPVVQFDNLARLQVGHYTIKQLEQNTNK